MHWSLPFVFCLSSRFLFFTTIISMPSPGSCEHRALLAGPTTFGTRLAEGRGRLGQWVMVLGRCLRSVVYASNLLRGLLPARVFQLDLATWSAPEDSAGTLSPACPAREMAVVLFGVPCLSAATATALVCILGGSKHRQQREWQGWRRHVAQLPRACFGP